MHIAQYTWPTAKRMTSVFWNLKVLETRMFGTEKNVLIADIKEYTYF